MIEFNLLPLHNLLVSPCLVCCSYSSMWFFMLSRAGLVDLSSAICFLIMLIAPPLSGDIFSGKCGVVIITEYVPEMVVRVSKSLL